MGNRGRAAVDAAKGKKKKGRPSLLDLQKRNLRLQSQQEHDAPSPNPNPLPPKFAQSTSSSRRVTRRNPNPPQDDPPAPSPRPDDDDDDDDDEEGGGSGSKRKEKKLKLVLRLPSRSAGSGSDSDGPDPKRRKSSHGDLDKKVERNNSPKATASVPGDQADLGPTTPLPDKKLLFFILDRLQKKDTYGVFSEPVDPEELPDYHEAIEHPMDFGTVRKKLQSGEYANLEQFENDVLLISSNAMHYNAPDTIYFRQARSIKELAKKNFENLRQESDDNEAEPKTVVRRGRPPNKNKKVGRPPADRAASDFSSDTTLANAGNSIHRFNLAHDISRNGSTGDKSNVPVTTTRALHAFQSSDTFGWISEQKADRDEEYSGSALKGVPRYGRKSTGVDDTRRNTYKQSMLTYAHESPIFTTFDGEKKQLVPVGLHLEYAYARSLARFAAKLGPIGSVLAAKKIQRVLPPGSKFGPGWVIDNGASQQSQLPLVSTSAHPSAKPAISPCTTSRAGKSSVVQEKPPSDPVAEEGHSNRTTPPPASTSSTQDTVPVRVPPNHENGSNTMVSGTVGSDAIRPKAPPQHHQNLGMPRIIDGFNSPFNTNMISQFSKMARPAGALSAPFGSGAQMKLADMTHAQALDMFSRATNSNFIHQTAGRPTFVDNSSTVNSSSPLPDGNSDSVPPDLNVGFQSPGSPATRHSQQPDLALQL